MEVRKIYDENNLKETKKESGSEIMKIYIMVNEEKLEATLEDNISSLAFYEKLKEGPLTIKMEDYANFEKVGNLGFKLPTADKNISVNAGDIILYQGDKITIYYDKNSYNFTRLGKIDDVDSSYLKEILGKGSVEVIFSKEKYDE